MKTYRTKEMVTLALLMSMGMNSCSDNEPQGPETGAGGSTGIVTKEKRLMHITEASANGEWMIKHDFVYDDKGRLITCAITDVENEDIDIETINYTWSGNTVIGKMEDCDETYKLELQKNLIRKVITSEHNDEDNETSVLTSTSIVNYTPKNRVKHIITTDNKSTEKEICTFKWNDEKLSEILLQEEDDDPNTFFQTFTYTNHTCKGHFPIMLLGEAEDPFLLVHPELMGMRTKQLPAGAIEDYYDSTGEKTEKKTYSYTLDNDGYITKCVEKTEPIDPKPGQQSKSRVFTLVWH